MRNDVKLRLLLFTCVILVNFSKEVFSQSTILLPDKAVNAIINEVSGELALQNEKLLGAFEMNRPKEEYLGTFRETEIILKKLKEYGFDDVHVEIFNPPVSSGMV